jgi:hypothetical protein
MSLLEQWEVIDDKWTKGELRNEEVTQEVSKMLRDSEPPEFPFDDAKLFARASGAYVRDLADPEELDATVKALERLQYVYLYLERMR